MAWYVKSAGFQNLRILLHNENTGIPGPEIHVEQMI